MSDTERIHVFSNGDEYRTWLHNNCDACVKEPDCPMRDALASAYVLDGTVTTATARRLGVPADGRERWWCNERQTETDEPTWPPPLIEGEPVQLPGFDQVDEKPAEQRRQPWTG